MTRLTVLCLAATLMGSCTLAKPLVSIGTGPAIYLKERIESDVHPVWNTLLVVHGFPFVVVGSPIVGLFNGVVSDVNVVTRKVRSGHATRFWWHPMRDNKWKPKWVPGMPRQ